MIRLWTIEDFKIFKGKNPIRFSGLTVFAGKNSSGKTSVIQTILLFAQSTHRLSGDIEDIYTESSARFILNGPLVRLGDYNDIAHYADRKQAESISFSFVLDDHRGSSRIDDTENSDESIVENNFHFTIGRPTQKYIDLYDLLHPTVNHFSFRRDVVPPNAQSPFDNLNIDIVKKTHGRPYKLDDYGQFINSGANNYRITEASEIIRDDIVGRIAGDNLKRAEIIGVSFAGLFPDGFAVKNERSEAFFGQIRDFVFRRYAPVGRSGIRRIPLEFKEAFMSTLDSHSAITDDTKSLFQFYLFESDDHRRQDLISSHYRRDVRTNFLENQDALLKRYKKHVGEWFSVDMKRSRLAQPHFRRAERFFASGVRYLGPLRDDPKPLYPVGNQRTSDDLGVRGEFTAAVLDRFKDQPTVYIDPKSVSADAIDPTPTRANLRSAVRSWLQYLEMADDFETNDMGKLGHELKIRTTKTGKFHDLTNVGVGVSQVLPIITLCLIAPLNACIIIEQPELHLHPAVSSKLADFFISIHKIGKQCVIESHGQHIIERLRLRIIQGSIDTSDLSIQFFEGVHGRRIVREVEFNNYGNPIEWPSGFFDETMLSTERLLDASSRKFLEE